MDIEDKNKNVDLLSEDVSSEIFEIANAAADDFSMKEKFSVEVLEGIDGGDLKVRLCTGSVLLLPESVVKGIGGTVVSQDSDGNSHLYARVSLNSSTPEGKVICQLAADLESLTAGQNSQNNSSAGRTVTFSSEDTKVYLFGTACKFGGNKTTISSKADIKSYSLGDLGGDKGVFIIRDRMLGSRTIEITHDRTAVCGTRYRGDLVLYVTF